MFWFDALKKELESAGFTDVRRIDATPYYDKGKVPIKLVVEARRR